MGALLIVCYPAILRYILLAVYASIYSLIITTAGCALLRNTTYNLLTRVEVDGTKEFDFIIGVDLIKDMGGEENKVVDDLLRAELSKREYCKNGYIVTSRGTYQGGGYLLFRGRCK